MSTREPMVYPMPAGYELGMLVQQIAEESEPRAIILDFLQRTILVHPPSEDGTDTSDFTAESLAFLLASVALESADCGLADIHDQFITDNVTASWLCAHPSREADLTYEGDVLWTKIIEDPDYLLLVTKSSDQAWRLIGLVHPRPQSTK